jgi:hypothetical protein
MADQALNLLLAFDEQARKDRQQDPAFLHRRDRKLALEAAENNRSLSPAGWLSAVRRYQTPQADASGPLRHWHRINRGFFLAGTFSGVMAMAGVLAWEGTQRINLTLLLALILLQLVLGLGTGLQGLFSWQPWRWLTRRLASPDQTGVLNALSPQLMTRAAQGGGLMFSIAALATLLVMVVVQDLAFGWSTTLDTGAGSYHRLVSVIATPWQGLIPAAVPSPELVEATRFFRTEALASDTDPVRWGQWWPFVALAWLVYAMVPRLLLWLLAHLHLRWRAGKLLNAHPDMTALIYRMETPCLDSGNTHNDSADLPDTDTDIQLHQPPADTLLISWAGAGRQNRPDNLPQGSHSVPEAGGAASLAEERALVDATGAQLGRQVTPAATVLVNAWEPPTGELADFLTLARARWPQSTRIFLFALAHDTRQVPSTRLLAQWSRFVQRMDDPALALAAAQEAAQ